MMFYIQLINYYRVQGQQHYHSCLNEATPTRDFSVKQQSFHALWNTKEYLSTTIGDHYIQHSQPKQQTNMEILGTNRTLK